jgi:transcriptional regulator with XRE-family HTH domain
MDVLHRRLVKRIRALALAQDIPLNHLADRAGVTRSYLFRVLAGTSSPTTAWIAKVAKVLAVDPGDLVEKPRARRSTSRSS